MNAVKYFFLGFLFPSFLMAQGLKSDFPPVSKSDFLQTFYDKDSLAPAVILYDQGEAIVDAAYGTTMKRYVRARIYHMNAFYLANVVLFTPAGNITQIKAYTHTYDKATDQIVRTSMNEKAIIRSKFNDWVDQVVFALPNVTEGAIIEYSYTNKMQFGWIPNWTFQHTVPVKYSEYKFYAPFQFEARMRGNLKPPEYEPKYKGSFKRWVMRDVPAFYDNPAISGNKIEPSMVYMESASNNWGRLALRYYQDADFGNDEFGRGELKRVAEQLTRDLNSDEEKIEAISRYVKNQIKWTGSYRAIAYSPVGTLKNKKGNSSEVNYLMASLLRKAGVNTFMMLISTRSKGSIDRKNVSEAQFNHALCVVPAKDTLILDATEKMLPYNILPKECLNWEGLLVGAPQYRWIKYGPKIKEKKAASLNATLHESGTLSGTISVSYDEYAALDTRNAIKLLGRDEYVKSIAELNEMTITKTEIQMDSAAGTMVKESHEFSMRDKTENRDGTIYFNPFLFCRPEYNKFRDKQQTYAIDFGWAEETIYFAVFKIPPGYKVESVPTGKVFGLPDNAARYTVDCQYRDEKIILTTKMQRSKLIFQPNEYVYLQEFLAQAAAKNDEYVVLTKVN